jgi:alanine racemase
MTGIEEPPSGYGAILDVDLAAIADNWRTLSARHPSGPVAGVVKADGYGLGAPPIAAALHGAGCRHFFVAHPSEALAIRDRVPGALLGVLNGLLPGSEDMLIANDIAPVLGSLAEVDAWAAAARRTGRTLAALLHVDTGMSRLGLTPDEVEALAAALHRLDGIDLRYVMTHLVSAEVPDDPMNEAQRARFAAACTRLPAAARSLANSSGIFLRAGFASDLARPGAALYGVNPTPGQPNPMRVAPRLQVRVLQVREVPAGATVGYNATWTAQRPSRIATACLGYADGWHRSQSGRGVAFFDGQAVPLVGRVSMDLTTYDATDHPGIVAGAWLELLGPNRSPDEVAEAAGTNGYEVLTSLGRRFHRRYRPA